MKETVNIRKIWTITKYANDKDYANNKPFDVVKFEGNVVLNGGIAELIALFLGNAATAYSEANSYLGVGDSNAAEDPTQTGLQAAVNKAYKPMSVGYPLIVSQSLVYQSVFGSADANFSWQEFSLGNADLGAGVNFNRKISDQGTKSAGQTFTLNLTLAFS